MRVCIFADPRVRPSPLCACTGMGSDLSTSFTISEACRSRAFVVMAETSNPDSCIHVPRSTLIHCVSSCGPYLLPLAHLIIIPAQNVPSRPLPPSLPLSVSPLVRQYSLGYSSPIFAAGVATGICARPRFHILQHASCRRSRSRNARSLTTSEL